MSREEWKKKMEGAKKRDWRFTTTSDMEVPSFVAPEDLDGFDHDKDLGYPGEFPYTRGVQSSMYMGRLWTMRQFAGFGSAADTNKRFKYLLSEGNAGLSVAFDLPTLMGRDSDDPLTRGEVGLCGVAIDTLKDIEALFDSIPLEKVTTSMTINSPAAILLAMYIVAAEKQGAAVENLRGTVQNDILKEYIAQKEWIYPPVPSMRIITDMIAYCTEKHPKWNTISISGYHIREAGSTAVQELAFTLADGIGYVQACIDEGLDVDKFAPRLSFFFNAHNDFFEEVAKYRAARRMWAKIMKERFKAKDPRSWLLRFHTQTAGCSLTAQQPMNNVIRVALQALSAVMGGTQSLHTNSLDETYALPTESAVTIALRTQQIIAEESGVANTIDPLGGSYFVEEMTNRVEKEALDYINKIDELGGILKAIEIGYPQKEIANAAYLYQTLIDDGKKTVVGVNRYVVEEENTSIETLKISPEVEKQQVKNLAEIKASRDAGKVKASLDDIRDAAKGKDNLMLPIIDAVRNYASVGEICNAMKEVFGSYTDPGFL